MYYNLSYSCSNFILTAETEAEFPSFVISQCKYVLYIFSNYYNCVGYFEIKKLYIKKIDY